MATHNCFSEVKLLISLGIVPFSRFPCKYLQTKRLAMLVTTQIGNRSTHKVASDVNLLMSLGIVPASRPLLFSSLSIGDGVGHNTATVINGAPTHNAVSDVNLPTSLGIVPDSRLIYNALHVERKNKTKLVTQQQHQT